MDKDILGSLTMIFERSRQCPVGADEQVWGKGALGRVKILVGTVCFNGSQRVPLSLPLPDLKCVENV